MEISKGQKYEKEEISAENLGDEYKNSDFGFQCLHYSVSEAKGKMQIPILNKSRNECRVRVKTLGVGQIADATATPDEDYVSVDKVLEFKKGEPVKMIEVEILDDDEWEPDEDFFVQLYKAETDEKLKGKDTMTKITIIDDDKPGMLVFKEKGNIITAPATKQYAEIVIERIKGSDGRIIVDYTTLEVDGEAKEGIDY